MFTGCLNHRVLLLDVERWRAATRDTGQPDRFFGDAERLDLTHPRLAMHQDGAGYA